jgi:pilus assembly protein CpaF
MGSRLSRLNRSGSGQPSQPLPDEQPSPVSPPEPAPVIDQIPQKKRTSPRVATLRKQLRPKLLATPDEFDQMNSTDPEHQQIVRDRLRVIIERARIELRPEEHAELEQALIYDLLGFGAIEPLVQNKSYTEIMVNGPSLIFAEYKGKILETEYEFDDEEHVQWTVQRIVRPLQRDLSRKNPMVDARLPDGSRVHVIMPPSSLQGTTITVRKFPEKRLTVEDLIRWGSLTEDVAEFLQACVVARLNIVVSGGTGSGKTTLLNVLSSFIPGDERIVTIEDSAELQLAQRHVVRLETCPVVPGTNEGQLVIRDLVKGSLRMRPDRIVVGECRSGEALDMLQAMNTGHDGSLTTVHSNSPRDCVARLETLALMAGMDLPVTIIRRQITSAVNLIVQLARLKDGSRRIVQIAELQGMEGDQVTLQDIFLYQTPDYKGGGYSHSGGGALNPTGFRPSFMDRLEEVGFRLSGRIFGAGRTFN